MHELVDYFLPNKEGSNGVWNLWMSSPIFLHHLKFLGISKTENLDHNISDFSHGLKVQLLQYICLKNYVE